MDVRTPIPKDEAARLAALRTYNVLDTPPEAEFDELCRLAAQICDAPLAAITLVDGTRQWYKARIGLPVAHTPRTQDGFCANVVLGRELMQIPDVTLDSRFANAPAVRTLGVRFYAGAPLVNRENLVLGTLCVLDRKPRALKPEQLEALRVLARQVMSQLELRRLVMVGDFRERLVSIVAHDLRQPLQQVLLAMKQQRQGSLGGMGAVTLGDEEQRCLSQIAISAERLVRMVRDALDFAQTRLGNGLRVEPRPARLERVCRALVQEFGLSYPNRSIELELSGDASGEWDEDRVSQAVSNLLANALRYGAQDRPVKLSCVGTERAVTLEVWNDGPPIPSEMLPRLFSPWCRSPEAGSETEAAADEGAPSSPITGLGLGLFVVKEVATASGGTVEVHSRPGRGTTFRMILPRRTPVHGMFGSRLRH